MAFGISITDLEKSVERYAVKLRGRGYEVEVDTFKTGPSGTDLYGPSNVTLNIERAEPWFWLSVEYIAYGYWAGGLDKFGGNLTWREMKDGTEVLIVSEEAKCHDRLDRDVKLTM